MATAAGSMAIEPIADPRANPETNDKIVEGKIMERNWGLEARVDSTVTFEEFAYWAEIERADEQERNRLYVEKRGPMSAAKVLKGRFSHGVHHEEQQEREKAAQRSAGSDQKNPAVVQQADTVVTEEEWRTAARALKTASWGTVFFLITTDILGWGSCPYVLILPNNLAYADLDLDTHFLVSVMAPALLFTLSSLLPLESAVISYGAFT